MVDYLVSLNSVANGPDFSKDNIPDFFVYVPISTHRGCLLHELKVENESDYGYIGCWDPCHRGFWDHAGRLIPEAHAGEGLDNLMVITNTVYISDSVIRIEER